MRHVKHDLLASLVQQGVQCSSGVGGGTARLHSGAGVEPRKMKLTEKLQNFPKLTFFYKKQIYKKHEAETRQNL